MQSSKWKTTELAVPIVFQIKFGKLPTSTLTLFHLFTALWVHEFLPSDFKNANDITTLKKEMTSQIQATTMEFLYYRLLQKIWPKLKWSCFFQRKNPKRVTEWFQKKLFNGWCDFFFPLCVKSRSNVKSKFFLSAAFIDFIKAFEIVQINLYWANFGLYGLLVVWANKFHRFVVCTII